MKHRPANKRGAGKGGLAVLWRAGRAWPALPGPRHGTDRRPPPHQAVPRPPPPRRRATCRCRPPSPSRVHEFLNGGPRFQARPGDLPAPWSRHAGEALARAGSRAYVTLETMTDGHESARLTMVRDHLRGRGIGDERVRPRLACAKPGSIQPLDVGPHVQATSRREARMPDSSTRPAPIS